MEMKGTARISGASAYYCLFIDDEEVSERKYERFYDGWNRMEMQKFVCHTVLGDLAECLQLRSPNRGSQES